MNETKVTLGKGGRIHIPAKHRRALGFTEGEEVLVGIHDGAIRIETQNGALERARRLVRRIYLAEAEAGTVEGDPVENDLAEDDSTENGLSRVEGFAGVETRE